MLVSSPPTLCDSHAYIQRDHISASWAHVSINTEVSMQVVCTSTPEGRVYRFYRTSEDFTRALKPLVPFLLASHVDVIVGNNNDDVKLLLRVGPIAGQDETMLRSLVAAHLTCRCDPAPAFV